MSREQSHRVMPPIPIPIPVPIPFPIPFPSRSRCPGLPAGSHGAARPRAAPRPPRRGGTPLPPCAPGSAPSVSPLALFPYISFIFPSLPHPHLFILHFVLFWRSFLVGFVLFFFLFPSLPSLPSPDERGIPGARGGGGERAGGSGAVRGSQPPAPHRALPPPPGMQVGLGGGIWGRGELGRLSGDVGGKANQTPTPIESPPFWGAAKVREVGDSHPFAADPALDSAPTGPAGPPSPSAGIPKILFIPPQTHSPCSPSLAGGCCASFPPAVSNVLTTRFQGVFGAIFKACSQWLDLEIQA